MSEKKNSTDWQKLNEIFAEAIELATIEREVFLNRSCEGDENLRREVEVILSANSRAGEQNFLQSDVFTDGVRALMQSESGGTDLTEKHIGNYKIIREIGRGGMGAVYLAEREDFKKQVALKIIKRGMDSDDIVHRFERERQVLASLNHPNIAHLLDGGTTAGGLPFFVMEYVEGEPITEFCDRQKLNIEERLRLFRKVCAAVAYAHQNLIVHRDIKPSNILVDNLGEPKLLDFGISKLLATDAAENTATEVRLMTPEYASPEQIRGERITTVSDIYSLGVLLYELLSGHRPFKLKNCPSAEILKIVSEEEPPAPSTAALTAEEIIRGDTKKILSPATIAEWRATNPPERLRRRLCGDLDNIVLMSLRKEPATRYSSVEQFSEDLRRHLSGLPVTARPATFSYRVSKFARRHRVPVAFAGIALMAILTGFSIAVWQAVVARQERARAEQRFNEVRKLANSLLNDYQKEVGELPGSYAIRVKLLRASSEYLDALAQDTSDPTLLQELAKAYLHLGGEVFQLNRQREEAKKHTLRAIEIARRLADAVPTDLDRKEFLAKCLDRYDERFGQFDRNEALEINMEAVRLREEIIAARPNDLEALNNLSEIYINNGIILDYLEGREKALESFSRAIEARKRQIALLQKAEVTSEEYNYLFWAELWIGILQANNFEDWTTATETFRQTVQIGAAAAQKYPDSRRLQTNKDFAHSWLAKALARQGDYQGALEHYRICLQAVRANAAQFNLYTGAQEAKYTLKIAEMTHKLGQTSQAIAILREALAFRRETSKADAANPGIKTSHAVLFSDAGRLYAEMGKFEEARAAYQEAENTLRESSEVFSGQQGIYGTLANLYLRLGDLYADCPADTIEIKQKNTVRLQEARRWYQKSVNAYAEFAANNLATRSDQENRRTALEKAAICDARLNGKS